MIYLIAENSNKQRDISSALTQLKPKNKPLFAERIVREYLHCCAGIITPINSSNADDATFKVTKSITAFLPSYGLHFQNVYQFIPVLQILQLLTFC